jgi:DNA-binding MarR family transcriptional regulator
MDGLEEQPGPPLARLLLFGSRWFDAASTAELARRGWPRLSPAQTLAFAVTGFDRITVATLARRLGHSRQATHQLVRGLVAMNLYELTENPRRRGGRLISITDHGTQLATAAYHILLELEASLGPGIADGLRDRLLALDFEGRALPPAADLSST